MYKVFWAITVFTVLVIAAGGLDSSSIAFAATRHNETQFEKGLVQFSNQANKSLPMTIDRNTRLDSTVAGPGNRLTYFYTLTNHSASQVNPPSFRTQHAPRIKQTVCGSSDMQSLMKKGMTAVYIYRTNDGKEVMRLDFAPSDCGY